MRNMSFALTTGQIIGGTKTVTRRMGWLHLNPGDQVRPVRKCMGLKPGEKLDVLRDPLTVVSVRRDPLRAMLDNVDYGFTECRLEGFGEHPDYQWPSEFVAMFCATHKGCMPETLVTRIEFSYHSGPADGSQTIEPPKQGDGRAYTALRRQSHRLAKKLGIEFTPAFDLISQRHGFRDAQHAIHWLIPMDWWGPCDPPTSKTPP